MSLFNNRDKMWFGTEQKMGWIETPNTGADVSSVGMSAESTLLTGGGYVRNSWDSHKRHQFSWGESASPGLASLLQAYRNGSYGRGLIYFHDPMYYGTNILPKRWADPSMAVNFEAEPLIPDVWPTASPNVVTDNNYPINSAMYPVPGNYSSQTNSTEHFIPIPEGMHLILGAVYSGIPNLYVRTPAGITDIVPMGLSDLQVANTIISDQPWARIGIRNPSASSASIAITAMTARLSEDAPTGGRSYTNLATNPSFEAAGSTVEMYRNRAPYPGDAPTGTGGWTGYRTSLSNPGGFIRGTVTENAGVQSLGIVGPTGAASMLPVTPGDVWTLTTELRSAKTVAIGLQYYDASGTYIPGTQAVGTSITPGTTDFAVSKLVTTVPAGAAYMRWMNFFNQASIVVGDTMDMRRWTAERGAALGRPFSGYASPDPDLIAAWAGAAGASETILSGVVPATVTSNGSAFASASPVRSTHWAAHGDYSLRIMPKANASYATLVVTGLTAGLTYTFLATAHLDAPQTGPLHASARSLYTGFDANNRAQAPNEAGNHPLQVTVVATSAAATVVFYNGSTGTDIWYDDFAVIEGAYSGGYFDGNTSGAVWTGIPDASTSTFQMPIQGEIGSGPWMTGEGNSGCRFVGNPTVINYNGVGGGQIGLNCVLKETGAWE